MKVLDVIVDPAAPVAALVMEAALMDLRQLMKASAGNMLPPELAVIACTDALRGLQHLHGHNILHRDFKPGNLLVHFMPTFGIRLADLGSARQCIAGDMTLMVCIAWYSFKCSVSSV